MTKIEIYDVEARMIEKLADKYDTTIAEIVELICETIGGDIELGLRTEEEIFN